MVTTWAVSQQPGRPVLPHQSSASQIPSFPTLPSSTMDLKSSSKMPTMPFKSQPNKPFLSPNPTETWSTDDDSGSSSGQDEFHLERYSQEAEPKSTTMDPRKRDKLSSRSRGNRRPDLNIITELPGSQARACDAGIVVEEVKARRAATTRPKSVVSAKAEHVQNSFPPHRSNAIANLKETARLRHERNKAQQDLEGRTLPQQLRPHDQLAAANLTRLRDRSKQKPVVIGISIPKGDAGMHRGARNDESAITLRTPSIVVTPADADTSLSSSQASSRRREVSSFYSTAFGNHNIDDTISAAPPVPQVPGRFNNFSRPSGNASTDGDPNNASPPGHPRDSIDSWEQDELDDTDVGDPPRLSSESQTRILPPAADPNRPKSQGWWNLMLSPMLSRAGTHKSTTGGASRNVPPVPPLPSTSDKTRSRSSTLESQISPETPRRLGLASGRASTWSRWATWERQRGQKESNSSQVLPRTTEENAQHTGLFPVVMTEGLAAEYYRACAIEQLSGEKYFECQNHSCAEGLPALQSIFDRADATEESSGNKGNASALVATTGAHSDLTTRSHGDNVVSPGEMSPNIRQADTGSIGKARAIASKSPKLDTHVNTGSHEETIRSIPPSSGNRAPSPLPVRMPSPSRSKARIPNIATKVSPSAPVNSQTMVTSPGSISPDMQRSMASEGAVPMREMRSLQTRTHTQATRVFPQTMVYNYDASHDVPSVDYIHTMESKPSPKISNMPLQEEVTRDQKKEKSKEDKPSLFSRLRTCAKARKAIPPATEPPKKRRWPILIFIFLLLMIIGIVALATQLTRRGDQTPTQQQWLNLTGYPPMPTGISTIVRPNLVQMQDQCVSPSTMWSCALPKEDQPGVTPNNPDQPNFRFEIKFRNGTVPANMTIPITSSESTGKKDTSKDPFTNDLFTPNPPPPSRAEQLFLGNTTDNITSDRFDGEETPFYMTFIPAFPIDPNDPSIDLNASHVRRSVNLSDKLDKRQNLSSSIPPPSNLPDGSASPSNLLPEEPYPFAQPIRLYNRGLEDEHYGFYMYFDKSIFLGQSAPVSSNDTSPTTPSGEDNNNNNDTNGGATKTSARARCTFSQTRFLVKIYTSQSFLSSAPLLGVLNTTTPSATNYQPPGSFPYPASVTLDRHGGTTRDKLVFCYAMNTLQVLDPDEKSVIVENRAFGGVVVNPAPGLVQFESEAQAFDPDAGGVDGGTGGCSCRWQNFS